MNHKPKIFFAAAAASFLTITILSQENTIPNSDRFESGKKQRTSQHSRRLNSAAKASDVIGMTVNNYQDEKLGKVEDLAVDVESGRIVQVILSSGGFAGVGDRLTAVPPGALHHDVANKVLHLDSTQEKVKNAPEFKTANWAEGNDSKHLSAVYNTYGQEPAFQFIHNGDGSGTADTAIPRNTNEGLNKDRIKGEGKWMIPTSRLGKIQRASKLMGMTVKNQEDEKLGSVENLLVDVQSGRIVALVVSSGGFLGIGNELSAVPPTALTFNTERDTLLLNTSKAALTSAPHFNSDQWPDFNQPAYSDGVYRAYNVEPYFNTTAATDADNTARNVRDRGNRTLTPLDQGNSQTDVDTTAQIRKGILANGDMSVNAKNVKIITNNGAVTLRGPVNTSEEKRLIGDIANTIARVENVDNQLEVK